MSKISVSQAAKILNVSIKTLQRWDEDNTFPALREEVSNSRIYDEDIVMEYKAYRDARVDEKAHLNKLGPIRQAIEKFIVTQPLEPGQPAKVFDGKDMAAAYKALDQWNDKERQLRAETMKHFDVLKKLEALNRTK
jgi:DNA-binding transcriptional MerR regulator